MIDLKADYIELMATIELDHRYYAYIDAQSIRPTELMPSAVIRIVESILTAQIEDVTYDKKEKFFRYSESTPPYRFVHTIAFSGFGALELLLAVHTPTGSVGGAIHTLARNIGLWRDKSFNRSPRYPKIPFSDDQELSEAMTFSLALFDDIKQTVTTAEFGQ